MLRNIIVEYKLYTYNTNFDYDQVAIITSQKFKYLLGIIPNLQLTYKED